MTIRFVTPTKISLIDFISMGDSSKRGDENTLGLYDSGLKYSIALLLRANVDIRVGVFSESELEQEFTFDTYIKKCDDTGKEKELIRVCKNGEYIETGFAKALGHNWELWMALREIWSNMLDEKGYVSENTAEPVEEGTVFTLSFGEDNEFYDIWKNKESYILDKSMEDVYEVSGTIEAIKNKLDYVRVYKQGILVYENKEVTSPFAFNINHGDIDERRILSNVWSVKNSIIYSILNCTNDAFLRQIITSDFSVGENDFLNGNSSWDKANSMLNDIAYEVQQVHGDVKSYSWVIDKIKERKDCKIKGKAITTVEDSIFTYSKKVTIDSAPKPIEEKEDTFQDKVSKLYNFKIDVEVKTAKLVGSKVVADKFEKCLIISEDFDTEQDFPVFVVQYLDLVEEGNVVDSLSNYICKLIKK